MGEALEHHGSDNHGQKSFRSGDLSVGLGHERLSIIDLSPAASQPMTNEDDSIWLVFNGEIYNFKELRTELEQRGHRFKSSSDSEVIIHLYEERGPQWTEYLRGFRDTMGHFQIGHPAFLMGQYSVTGWWYYFPMAVLLKILIPLLVSELMALFFYSFAKKTSGVFSLTACGCDNGVRSAEAH